MLQKIRIGAAWIVMGFFLLVFIGGELVSTGFADKVAWFQFTPSLVKFLLTAGGITSLGFLVILALTLVFGRIYCACLCPLGIMQDVIIFFARKRKKKKPDMAYQPTHIGLRYGILFVTLLASILGTLALLNLLDPYSLFGRIATHLFKPVFVFFNNLLASWLEIFDIYAVTTLAFHDIPLLVLGLSLAFFLLLSFMALRGRMYCNTLCPVGTLLGLLSSVSLLKIRLKQETCIACGICEKACRGGCIDSQNKKVNSSRCVACFDCLSVCPKASLEYTTALNISEKPPVDPARRKILLGSASALGSLVVFGIPLRTVSKPLIPKGVLLPVSPPGSLSHEHFTETCTACHLCVSACPSKVIHPTFLEYGLQGMMQPALDYNRGTCAYECNICGYVCPTGAITRLTLAEKKLTQIGKAKLVKDDCLVHAKDQECGACVEVCPTHAVYTEEKNGILYPETNIDHCIGCGYCQLVCPQIDPKAIFVEANQIHAIAKEPLYEQGEPDEELVQPQPESEEDFPF